MSLQRHIFLSVVLQLATFYHRQMVQCCVSLDKMEVYYGQAIHHLDQHSSCQWDKEGRPEAPLMTFCREDVGNNVKQWRRDGANVWTTYCDSNSGLRYNATPIAVFDDDGGFDANGAAAIFGFCVEDGIWVLNQWCGKEKGFGWHKIGVDAARSYYKIKMLPKNNNWFNSAVESVSEFFGRLNIK